MRVRCRGGFTLLEVIVAITVGAMVAVAAHQLLAAVADTTDLIPRTANAANAARNRERLLRDLVAGVEVGADTTQRFDGERASVQFDSWCRVAAAWLERCKVRLELIPVAEGIALEASGVGRRGRLATHKAPARIMYLRTAANGGVWLPRWGRAISAPLAIRIEWSDTSLFLPIGPRG